ncbi:MAG: PTS sugar transporter subunit IIA [Thermodesulfobacteriota bacterium]|nr:PTS sugar transporter subunit IIA [Thermodesulfobacteriota bacterium]
MKLGISEIAQRLDLNPETLVRWIRQGRIPIDRQGQQGIFKESELRAWAARKQMVYKRERSAKKESETRPGGLALYNALTQGGCFNQVPGSDKAEVLKNAVELVPGLSQENLKSLLDQLIAREQLTSTGIGRGVAVPHPRTPMDGWFKMPMILTCFLENEIDFDSIDKMPVSILFLILSPTMETHLAMLSKLSYFLRDNSFVDFLKTFPAPDDFFHQVKDMEKNIETSGIQGV